MAANRVVLGALLALGLISSCSGDISSSTQSAGQNLDDDQRCAAEARDLGLDVDSMTATDIDDTPSPADREFGCAARLTDGTFVHIRVPAHGDATFTTIATDISATATACDAIFQTLLLTARGVSGEPVKNGLEAALAASDLTNEQRRAVQRSLDQFTLDQTSPSFDPFGAYYDLQDVYTASCPNAAPTP